MIEMKKYKLGECLSMIQNGATIPQKEGAGGLPITRIETLSNDLFNRDRLGYANITDVDKYADYILQDKDILMSHINSRTFLGRAVQYHKNEDETIIHGMNLLRIKANTSILDTDYLYYFFKTPYFKKCVDCKRTDAVNQSSINISNIKDISINLPPLSVQQKVASILSSLDRKIALNKQINQNLEALARQLYDYWFVQFDFPNEEGKPYKSSGGKMVYNPILKREIPEGWEVQTLQKVSTICRGSIITEAQTRVGSVKVVAAAITYSYLHDIANRSANVITISSSGANAGYMNFWRESIFASDCITVQCEKDIDTILTYHQLELYRDAIMKKSRGSAQPHVYPSDIESLPCICVPDYLKNMVCELFISYNKQIASNSIEIEALTKQRDELLPLLMNGQVSVE